mgnify:CR=1 FL=1
MLLNNLDRPGMIGHLGTLMGRHNVNIASMSLSRDNAGGQALTVLNLDSVPPAALLEEIKALPAYETYLKRREEREKQDAEAEKHELKGVKYRRLVDTLESIVLAKNLAQVASPEINAGYQKMRKLEDSSLRPK